MFKNDYLKNDDANGMNNNVYEGGVGCTLSGESLPSVESNAWYDFLKVYILYSEDFLAIFT